MKSKEEIEQLAKKSAQKKYRLQHIPLEQIDEYGGEIKDYVTIFIQGYTQCHEYMANKYRESKLREAKDVIAAFIKGYSKCEEYMADKKYTEEDLMNAFNAGINNDYGNGPSFDQWLNSLNKKD